MARPRRIGVAGRRDARALGAQGAARLLDWSRTHPERWTHLLTQGLAYASGDPPAYFYSMFKTVDGNMRTYVRAGGPAYAAAECAPATS